jgi:predicted phosphodiesterase
MMHLKQQDHLFIGRRALLKAGTLILSAGAINGADRLFADDHQAVLRIGLVTDLHHADKPPAGTRFYRESIGKLAEAKQQFATDRIDFVVELGDLIDAADTAEVELSYLATINREFSTISADRHYVLGNHCVDTLTKAEFLGAIDRQQSYYSFDRGGYHFIVLDACFRGDGEPYGRRNFKWNDANIPLAELEWLRADLQQSKQPVIVFAHQRIDVNTDHGVKNNAAVRQVLEASSKVLAVFQGHSHQNDIKDIGGIHYCTLVAMVEGSGVENNGYSVMRLDENRTIQISGFRHQAKYRWA